MKKISRTKIVAAAAMASAVVALATPSLAHHRWSTYHWARTSDKIRPDVGDNVGQQWKTYLREAVDGGANGQPGWNDTAGGHQIFIESTLKAGATNPKNCKPVVDRIEVCSAGYGRTGWLGIAQVWISNGHITQAITKLNDTYFSPGSHYDTPAWRRMVTCQEIGHDYGLGHNNETFADYNNGTCMDYTNAPQGGEAGNPPFNYGPPNTFPNAHDFEELAAIYGSHSDGGTATATATRSEAAGGDTPGEWGRAIDYRTDGRPHVYEMVLPSGVKKITHVFWAHGEGPRGPAHH